MSKSFGSSTQNADNISADNMLHRKIMKKNNSRLTAGSLAAAALSLSALSGLCANPAYPTVVVGDGALGYYRFNDSLARSDINFNSGSLGAGGNATNDLEFVLGGSLH